MTAPRAAIFDALTAALGPCKDAGAIAAEADALLDDIAMIRPTLPNRSLVDVFAERVSLPRMGATVERVARLQDVPGAVQRYLREQNLPLDVALQPSPALRGLDWSGVAWHDTPAPDEAAGVGIARFGVAETGSVVFHSGNDTPVLLAFLPLHHIVAVHARDIVAYLEDFLARSNAAAPGAIQPRNLNIITGASGTTDIEGSYVRGAHGPGYLHVVIIEDQE